MKHFSAICFSVALGFGLHTVAKAQGSADPGLSSVGGLRSASALAFGEDTYENDRLHLSFSNIFATGDRDVVLNMPRVEARIPLSRHSYLEAQLPFYAVRGDLGKNSGIGDAIVAYTYFRPYADGFTWQFTGGMEIGLSDASEEDSKGRSLPMVYQAGQGSTDMILGASVMYKQYVSLAVGYQQPIVRYNNNNYTGITPFNEAPYSIDEYPATNELYRRGDLMFRLEGHLTGTRAGVSAGPLAFVHLDNDMYVDGNSKYREIHGSEGFTMNIAGSAFYRMGRHAQWKIDLSGAFPVADHAVYPDGSRRQWLLTPRISYFFNQEALIFE